MNIPMKRSAIRIVVVFLLCLVSLIPAHTAGAVPDSPETLEGSLTILKYAGTTKDNPLQGVEFSIYRILSLETDGTFSVEADFDAFFDGVAVDDVLKMSTSELNTLIEELQEYIEAQEITALGVDTTDRSGEAKFTDLPFGWYLVLETAAPSNVIERSANFLVEIPMTNPTGTGWIYDVTAYPKNRTRTTPWTPDPSPTPTPDPRPTPSDPLSEIPDTSPPLGTLDPNDPDIEIPDDLVPLAEPDGDPSFDLPKTGGGLAAETLYLTGPLLMLLSLMIILAINRKRHKWLAESGENKSD